MNYHDIFVLSEYIVTYSVASKSQPLMSIILKGKIRCSRNVTIIEEHREGGRKRAGEERKGAEWEGRRGKVKGEKEKGGGRREKGIPLYPSPPHHRLCI